MHKMNQNQNQTNNQPQNPDDKTRPGKLRKWRAKLDTICLIRQGWTREDIVERLVEEFDYSQSTATGLYYEAQREACRSIEDYIKEASKTNVQKILSIIDQCYEDKRFGDALKGIDMLNKMGGLYAPEQHDIHTSTEPITISFE